MRDPRLVNHEESKQECDKQLEILAMNVMKWDRGQTTIMEEVRIKCNQVHMGI